MPMDMITAIPKHPIISKSTESNIKPRLKPHSRDRYTPNMHPILPNLQQLSLPLGKPRPWIRSTITIRTCLVVALPTIQVRVLLAVRTPLERLVAASGYGETTPLMLFVKTTSLLTVGIGDSSENKRKGRQE